MEIINVVYRVFSEFSFIQGMGLGAWWDDTAHKLLPDYGSGFMYKSRYTTTHMWYLTQWLKLGLVGLAVYWSALFMMFRRTSRYLKTMAWTQWEKGVMVGLHIGLLCAFISSADFVRLFQFVGINLGMTASYIALHTPHTTHGASS